MPRVRFETLPIDELIPAEYNPRTISEPALEGLGHSIERFGLVQPIVWNARTKRVVGGHQRLKVLKQQGVVAVPVAIVDLGAVEERALNVALNNDAITGEFTDGLQDVLRGILEEDVSLFRDLRLDELFDEEIDEDAEEEGPPALPTNCVTQKGDLWLLGEHRLVCGDSSDAETVARVVGDRECQCVWTDPPYGVDYGDRPKASKTRTSHIANDGDLDEAMALVAKVFAVADEYALRPGGAVYVATPNTPKEASAFYRMMEEVGWRPRQQLIWVKDRLAISRMDYHLQHETIFYGYKAGEGRLGRFGGEGWFGNDAQSTVFEFDRPGKSAEHPTMKPVALVAAMLVNSTRPGDFVFEPFSGSGSTLMACEQLKRRCVAVELEPAYCDVTVQRWEKETGKSAAREG